ncbi:MAG: class I SAM-dependent methyltransferase [Alphaproteobacteria bacterium]|jgi:SAM-dependent methyltransferase
MNSPCYNWDKSSWLSSKEYFEELSSQLIEFLDIREEKKILDVGCGRGHLLESLANKVNFIHKPIGVEPVKHENTISQRIEIINSSINFFFQNNNSKFDLVILKQVLHLLNSNEREYFYQEIKKYLNNNGQIVFIHMNNQTEIPQFPLMGNKLKLSIDSHHLLLEELNKNFKLLNIQNFTYSVKISLDEYLTMITNRYMTVLLDFSEEEIKEGIAFIKQNYSNHLSFNDTLTIETFG